MPTLKKLAQKKRIIDAVDEVRVHLVAVPNAAGLIVLRDRLEKVLDESQNAPPEGAADGSVDDRTFTRATRIRRALAELVDACHYWRLP